MYNLATLESLGFVNGALDLRLSVYCAIAGGTVPSLAATIGG